MGWQRATGHAPGPHVRPPVMWQAAAQGQAYGVPEGYEQQYAEGYEQQYAEGYEGQQYAEGYEGQEGCASSAPAHHRAQRMLSLTPATPVAGTRDRSSTPRATRGRRGRRAISKGSNEWRPRRTARVPPCGGGAMRVAQPPPPPPLELARVRRFPAHNGP